LAASEQKFKDIAELLPQIVYECDFVGNILFVNKQGLEIFRYSEEDFKKGVNMYQLFLPNETQHIRSNINILLKGGRPVSTVYSAIRKDGTIFPLQIHSNIVFRNNAAVGLRGIGIDMTRQKEVEQELIAAREKAEQSDKLKSAFLSNMSHEIRTPLNSIIGFSNLLTEENLNSETRDEFKKYIQNSADYLLNLINDIIDYSKIEAGQLEIKKTEFNLTELMKELYSHFSKERFKREKQNIQLVYTNNKEKQEVYIYSDPVRIKQIITNLLDNAFKFTEQGQVIFGYEFQMQDQILFFVKDTGIGISEKDKPLVFERFHRLYNKSDKIYPGSGLGLSICHNLVKLMEGNVWLDSEFGNGSSFYISLPVVMKIKEEESKITERTFSPGKYKWPNKTILIAEDELTNYELIAAILKKTDVTIMHAKNGMEVTEIVKKNPVDLILMDIQMPIMSGYDAIKELKIVNPDIPIIAQTAYAMAGEKEWILEAGSNAYIAKPIDPVVLLEMINEFMK
jgi:PAS domain S-box-containing protein